MVERELQAVAAKQLDLTGSSVWEYCALSPHWPPFYTRSDLQESRGVVDGTESVPLSVVQGSLWKPGNLTVWTVFDNPKDL